MARKRFIVAIALSGALALSSGCAHHHHAAGPAAGRAGAEGLTVVGTGEAKAPPDSARTSIGIEVRAESADAATAQANEKMTAVIAAIKGAGVADADLRTSDFSIVFERDYPPQPGMPLTPPAAAGVRKGPTSLPAVTVETPRGVYRVTNMVEVTIRDIAKTSKVLTAATDAGANNVWEVTFDIADRESLHAQARAQAIERAKESARQLAMLSGVTLGKIVAVEDEPTQGGGMVYASLRSEKAMAGAPIEPGQRTVTHQVRLVYDLR